MAQIPVEATAEEDDCFAIRQAARFVSQIYDQHLAKVGLTIMQYSILKRIYANQKVTMDALAAEMVMQRTSLVRALQRLRRDDLVAVTKTGKYGSLALELTQNGEIKLDMAYECWLRAQEEFTKSFGSKNAEMLRSVLLDVTSIE